MALWIRFAHAGRPGFGRLEGADVLVHSGDLFAGARPTGEVLPLAAVKVLTPTVPIACGTSLGVGVLRPGSTVEVTIDGIGTLSSPVVAAEGAP